MLSENQYDFLILLKSGNDILQNLPQTQLKENLVRMIELAQKHHVQVLLIAVPNKSLLAPSVPLYQELADTYDVPQMNTLASSWLKKS